MYIYICIFIYIYMYTYVRIYREGSTKVTADLRSVSHTFNGFDEKQ